MSLNLHDLDHIASHGCQVPGCTHEGHSGEFFLHGQCHPKAHLQVSYRAGTGTVRVSCAECGQPVTDLNLAQRRHYDDYHWGTMPFDAAVEEFTNRIYDAANMLNILEQKQRLTGTDLARKLVEGALTTLKESWRHETDPTPDEKGLDSPGT